VAELLVDVIAAAAAAAVDADVAVVVVGNHPMVGGRETADRLDLELPPAHDALIRAVHAANPNTVLVLTSGYPYAINWADANLPAVVWSAHGGQEFGAGLAEVLFGDADPAGRLTQTWYRSAADLPDLLDYDIIGNDMTYLYFRGAPLYPFGHGLSYTSFGYTDLVLRTPDEGSAPGSGTAPGSGAPVGTGGAVTVTVTVTNTGTRRGVDVVQLYSRQRTSTVKRPLRQLHGFARVELDPGEQTTVNLAFQVSALATWDVTRGRMVVEPACHQIMIGRSAGDIVLAAPLTVRGEPIPPRAALADRLRAADHDGYAGTTIVAEELASGDAVEATEPGGWIAFLGTDFGGGAATATLRVRWTAATAATAGAAGTAAGSRGGDPAAPGAESPNLTLRLENPIDGPVVGTTVVADTGDRYAWVDVPVALSGAAGVQDLYVVFSAVGTGLSTLAFGAVR
jgi:beta-glucosidase